MTTEIITSYTNTQAFNRALSYGDGVFETMRFVEGKIPLWALHYQRLCHGLERLQISKPQEKVITDAIEPLISEQSAGVLKLVVYRAGDARGYTADSQEHEWQMRVSSLPDLTQNQGVCLAVADVKLAAQPLLAGLKHLNRLEQVLAALELRQQGCDDLIVCDQSGDVIESTSSNLIVIHEEKLTTPDTSQCGVEGVGLQWLRANYGIESQVVEMQDLRDADAVVLMNSVRGPRLVGEIKAVKSYGQSHPLHAKMKRNWDQLFT